jgi:hypothetical protein
MNWIIEHWEIVLAGFLLLDKIVAVTPCKWDDLVLTAVKGAVRALVRARGKTLAVLLVTAWCLTYGALFCRADELTYRIAPRQYQDWTVRAALYGPMLTQHMGPAFEDQQPFLRDLHWGLGGEIERKVNDNLGVGALLTAYGRIRAKGPVGRTK